MALNAISFLVVYSIWQTQGLQLTSLYKTLGDILITCSGQLLGIVAIFKYFPWGFW